VIHPYGALVVAGATIGGAITVGRAPRFRVARFDALACALLAFGFGLVSAAALYLAVRGEVGGLVWYGGFAGGLAAVAVYARAYGLSLAALADCAAPGVAFGHALGRVGCFFGGCCGPTQLHEAACLVLLGLLSLRGRSFARYLGGYALVRLALEPLRTDVVERGTLLGLPPSIPLACVALVAAAVYRGVWTKEYRRASASRSSSATSPSRWSSPTRASAPRSGTTSS
jgi:prolipoprotein diacylglyceryltransferase